MDMFTYFGMKSMKNSLNKFYLKSCIDFLNAFQVNLKAFFGVYLTNTAHRWLGKFKLVIG